MFTYQLNQSVALKPADTTDATELFALVNQDRQELRKWMPWVDQTKKVANERKFLQYIMQQQLDGHVYECTILVDGHRAGMIDVHDLDQQSHHGSIGYWLGSPFQGQGVMTTALGGLEHIAFTDLQLHKLMLGADVKNQRSRAVAERRHYHLDGILRENEAMNGTYVDEASYSLTINDWRANLD